MALSAGTRLGPYEITGQIGAGGMGEVYRAADTKLGRDVAIKTLPAELAGDKERLGRFEREAQLLAALNHAHIAAIHSLDEHEGTLYLAMELVEGETLEEKLKAGALSVEDSLRLALQIAEALEAAHGKGVVHRDLKPANIMVTPEGQVKVLDFGLAKAFSGNPSEASPAHSPALSLAMTQQGLVLGTAGYMSPEQASGQGTDQRADVWAYGVVLYEMLTGQPVFSGESVPHILAGVLRTEPDWDRLPGGLHPRLKLVLERCLTKNPRNRLHSVADARIEIEAVSGDPEGAVAESAAGTVAHGRSNALRVAAAAVVAAVVAGAAGWFLRPAPPPEPEPIVRFSVPLPGDQSFSNPFGTMIAISPDGERIAYLANNQIYLRNLNESEARPVPGTAEEGFGATTPTFSPDGQWLAYVHAASQAGPYTIKRVPISGGAPVPIHEASGVANYQQGLSWPTPDTIVFSNAEGVIRIPANGGAAEALVPRREDERLYSPQLLPGGEAVLFTSVAGNPGSSGGYDAAQVAVQAIGADERTVVWEGGSAARYLPTGHLVYAQQGALFAVRFDPSAGAIIGGPVPMLDGLRRSGNGFTDTANLALSDTGTLALIPGLGDGGTTARIETALAWIDRNGREEPFPVRPDDYTSARISPDGTKVALVIGASLGRDTDPAIWVYDLITENLSLLVADEGGSDGPVWSADSRSIYFRSLRADQPGVYSIELATGESTLVVASPDDPFLLPWSLSPDGQTLASVNAVSVNDINIATVSLSDGELTRLLHEETLQNEPSFSSDGNWISYHEIRPDTGAEINVRPFPDVARTRIPVGPGDTSVFSRDGSELFFVDGESLMVAAVEYEPTLRVGTPERVFESSAYIWNLFGRAWDVDPSGERFLLIRQPGIDADDDGTAFERIDVVLNWFEELQERVPVE